MEREENKDLIAICPICILPINDLANPNTCSHDFCYECLIEWSKMKAAKCPVCKKTFKGIICYTRDSRNELVLDDNDDISSDKEEIRTIEECMACGLSIDEDNLLICDFCNYNICHTYCDKLTKVPQGIWICVKCRYAIEHLDFSK